MLGLFWAAANLSLVAENPTVDEVIHLPAGISYWQRGDFRIYPHNPPLVKLIAAIPALWSSPVTDPLYQPPAPPSWRGGSVMGMGWATSNKASFGHEFAELNAARYFDLFTASRLVMPLFGVLGGVLVFSWSRRLYGDWGGLLSLALWCLCPNILAHTRLITTDVGATAIGFGATYAFWHYLQKPTWGRVVVAGVMLGLAQITKFSLLLLYGCWPVLWLIAEFLKNDRAGRMGRFWRSIGQGLAMVAVSVVVIDAGYGFHGLGKPLGDFQFTSKSLTTDRVPPRVAARKPGSEGPGLREGLLQYRVNRFRGGLIGWLPSPLPEAYLTGFDDQKMEAEGVPPKAAMYADDPRTTLAEANEIRGYPVFLDGELRSRSWWNYYLLSLVYKVPEGTWALGLMAAAVLLATRRSAGGWADELSLLLIPAVVILVMSFGTNIALGLRYVLTIFPYVFVSIGKLAPWAGRQVGRMRRVAIGVMGVCLAATAAATAMIHPHYLAYFNAASGGADRGIEHLIDSNLDWGQDLVSLKRWIDEHAAGEPVGIAYFGQINPMIFQLGVSEAGGPAPALRWFLPPARPGTLPERPDLASAPPAPGLYAVSASLVKGLPWRVYGPERWAPLEARELAFSYFDGLEPIDRIGHSIHIYRVTEEDARRLGRLWGSTRSDARD